MENFELYHFGIKGMHWGIRRYQNSDGSLTPAGIKRYRNTNQIRSINEKADEQIRRIKERSKIAKAESKAANRIAKAESKYLPKDKSSDKQKSISEMSDDEIRAKINRIRLENELKSLSPQQVSKGQKFVKSIINNVIAPAARDSGKKLLTDFLNKKGAELLGLDANKTKDAAKLLQEEVSYLTNLQKKDVLTKYFDDKQREADANAKAETDAKNQAKQTKEAEKQAEQAQKAAEKQAEQARKEAEKRVDQAIKEAEKRAEQARKEAEKQAKQAQKAAEKQAEQARKEAEKQAKQASKEARKQASSTTTSSNNYDYYVSGSGTSKRRTPDAVIIDADWKDVTVDDVSRSSLVTRGQNYVASLTGSDGMLMLPYRGGR